MKSFSFLILFFLSTSCFGQVLQDITGKPYVLKTYSEYEGSPLLFTNWTNASVRTTDGEFYENLLVNIDLYQGIPLFIKDSFIYTFVDDVAEITFHKGQSNVTFKKGKFITKDLPDVYFELINEEPIFLKNSSRKLDEITQYGTSNKLYKFTEIETYYVPVKGSLQRISLNKGAAEKVFFDKWRQLNSYATANRLSFKTEEGWQALLRYYQGHKK